MFNLIGSLILGASYKCNCLFINSFGWVLLYVLLCVVMILLWFFLFMLILLHTGRLLRILYSVLAVTSLVCIVCFPYAALLAGYDTCAEALGYTKETRGEDIVIGKPLGSVVTDNDTGIYYCLVQGTDEVIHLCSFKPKTVTVSSDKESISIHKAYNAQGLLISESVDLTLNTAPIPENLGDNTIELDIESLADDLDIWVYATDSKGTVHISTDNCLTLGGIAQGYYGLREGDTVPLGLKDKITLKESTTS